MPHFVNEQNVKKHFPNFTGTLANLNDIGGSPGGRMPMAQINFKVMTKMTGTGPLQSVCGD